MPTSLEQVETKRTETPVPPDTGARPGASFLFLRESVKSFTVTAAVFPSSRFLVAAMLEPIDFGAARIIVELGAGTGTVTRETLRRMHPDAMLYALDVNPAFVCHIRDRIGDSRLVPLLGHAEELNELLRERGVGRAHAVVSSLGLTCMSQFQRSSIAAQAAQLLDPRGVLTQYQYWNAQPRFAEQGFLEQYFRTVSAKRIVRNLPPATVYTCSQ